VERKEDLVVFVDLRMVMDLQDNSEKRKTGYEGISQKIFPTEAGNYLVL